MAKIIEKNVNSNCRKEQKRIEGMKGCKSKKLKSFSMPVNALMPSGYTFFQRAKLRKFENTVTK